MLMIYWFSVSLELINETRTYITCVFYVKDMGPVNVILSVKVIRNNGKIILS